MPVAQQMQPKREHLIYVLPMYFSHASIGLDSPLPILRVGLVSMNMLSSLSVVARSLPAKVRLGGLKTSLHPNLPDRPQPAEDPAALEERDCQVLARLADGDRGDERGGGRYRSRVPLQSEAPAPSVTGWMEWCGNI